MFDEALAFDRYRLEVVQRWPDGHEKDTVLNAIRASLVAKHPAEPATCSLGIHPTEHTLYE
jgi:hypothetical protein